MNEDGLYVRPCGRDSPKGSVGKDAFAENVNGDRKDQPIVWYENNSGCGTCRKWGMEGGKRCSILNRPMTF